MTTTLALSQQGFLRRAVEGDLADLHALEYELFPDNNFSEKMLLDQIRHGDSWVVECASSIAAYVFSHMDAGRLYDILRLGVQKDFRRRGFATDLLRQVLRNDYWIVTLSVLKSNAPAIALYRKHGFTIVGHVEWCNCWFMQLKADDAR